MSRGNPSGRRRPAANSSTSSSATVSPPTSPRDTVPPTNVAAPPNSERRHRSRRRANRPSAQMKPTDCCATTAKAVTPTTRPSSSGSPTTELTVRQVERLRNVLNEDVEIHGKENFPTLRISLHKLIVHVRRKLRDAGLHLKHVKMNGGAASYVVCAADDFAYSDLDLIFPMDLDDANGDFEKVRDAVFTALLELMPETRLCPDVLRDVYIRKMVKVADGDRWSLFSLHNDFGRCIELKFVDKMRRQFEFSVDSFQITLDPLLDGFDDKRPKITAESMFGDFHEALRHLNRRLIDTRSPEEIRGGGLLKYCHLLTRGYTATNNCREMEKYMCSRFFIDFSDIATQEIKLCGYLDNHFGNENELKFEYLQILARVIKESTVCLMGHERRLTLHMIERLRQHLSYNIYYHQQSEIEGFGEHTPRQILLYLPSNSNQFIRVA